MLEVTMQISRALENLFLLIILTLASSFIIDFQVGFIFCLAISIIFLFRYLKMYSSMNHLVLLYRLKWI